jgi:short subunit dehydrogenase-like uncharacterized protein
VIVLYGATGYTGGLIADELTNAGLTFTLAGRDATRLAALSEQRGGIPWAAASVDHPAGLRALLADARVVLTHTREVRVVQAAAGLAPKSALARLVQLGLPVGQAALRTPIYRLAQRAASRSPAGPTEQQREAAEFTVHVVAHSDTGAITFGTARGRDPYRLTAAALTQAARHMSEPDYSRAGALAPSVAFDPEALLRALEPVGLSWSVGPR